MHNQEQLPQNQLLRKSPAPCGAHGYNYTVEGFCSMPDEGMRMENQELAVLPASLQLADIGRAEGDRHPDRVTDYWVLGILENGEMHLCIDQRYYHVHAGEYYLLPAGVRHYGTQRSPWLVRWWHFNPLGKGPAVYRLPWCGLASMGQDTTEVHRSMTLMRHLGDHPIWVTAQLHALLARLCSINRRSLVGRNSRLAGEVLTFLIDHRQAGWDRRALEQHFGYTYRYLNRLFHTRFSASIHAKFQELQIDAAANLLATGAPIKEAARKTGFADYFYFIRRFRQLKGVSPGEYVRSLG
jgi:AraC-like DNA-binding protein